MISREAARTTRLRRMGARGLIGAITTVVAALALASPASAACANADVAIGKLGKARAEKAMLCGFNEWLRKEDRQGAAKADRYVRKAAIRALADRNTSIKHIIKRLSEAGFFRSGGKGFMRCSPMARSAATTPQEFVDFVTQREFFVFGGRHRSVGIAIEAKRIFVVVGRRS